MTPEPGSWLDPDPRVPDDFGEQVIGNDFGRRIARSESPARRSVVIPLVLLAAVVAGLIVFVVTR